MERPDNDLWSLPYWTSRLPHARSAVLAELDSDTFFPAWPARVAMEAAFESRDWDLAQHIRNHWFSLIEPNETNIKSSWLKREVLYYLRGKTSSQWMDLLLEAKACVMDKQDQSVWMEATKEIQLQVASFGETDHLARYIEVARKLMAQGGRSDEGSPDILSMVSRLAEPIARLEPSILPAWQLLLADMAQSLKHCDDYVRTRQELGAALCSENEAEVVRLAKEYAAIPMPHRHWSPLEVCLSNAENSPGYAGVKMLNALLDGGFEASAHQYNGKTPLYEVCANEVIPSAMRKKMVKLLLSRGADPDLVEEQGYCHHDGSWATPLHACSMLSNSPLEELLAHGANPHIRDASGATPLLYACRQGAVDMIEKLIAKGAAAHSLSGMDEGFAHVLLSEWNDTFSDQCESPQRMARALVLLEKAGADFSALAKSGKSAWEELFDLLNRTPRDAEVAALLQACEDQGMQIDWKEIEHASDRCNRPSSAVALVQARILELDHATILAARSVPRRM